MNEIREFSFTVEVRGGHVQLVPGLGEQTFQDHLDATLLLLTAVINHQLHSSLPTEEGVSHDISATMEIINRINHMIEVSQVTNQFPPLYKS